MNIRLPIDESLPAIIDSIHRNLITVVSAPPGSGKTTRVAPAILTAPWMQHQASRVYLLQPRRLAARSVAARIAQEQGVSLGGNEVGYHVRFEKRFNRSTRLIVATEGILLRKLQDDATLDGIAVVLMDEFHERSVDTDLLFGMLRQVQANVRDDLRLIIMSATLDDESLKATITHQPGNPSPFIQVEGRQFPVTIRYQPSLPKQSMVDVTCAAILNAVEKHDGDVLAFLPGQSEIYRSRDQLSRATPVRDCDLFALHGSLPLEEQTQIIQPSRRRKIVLATNVAETSLTIEGIRVVVDSGYARVMRFDPSVGLDRLCLESISQSSATQRAGRAGRVAEGFCYRLWSESAQRSLATHLEPEIRRVDLASAVLQLLAWGQRDVMSFPWLTTPRTEAIEAALNLLERIGAIKAGSITRLGQSIARLPLHPRTARMVLEGNALGCLNSTAIAAAMLAERDPFQSSRSNNSGNSGTFRKGIPSHASRRWPSDVATRVTWIQQFVMGRSSDGLDKNGETSLGTLHRNTVQSIMQSAKEIEQLVRSNEPIPEPMALATGSDSRPVSSAAPEASAYGSGQAINSEEGLMRALLAGYPDRLAKRRSPGKSSALMVGGRAVQLGPTSGVLDPDLFLCIDVDGGSTDAVVRQASGVQRDWLDPSLIEERVDLFFHPTQQQVVARRRTLWGDLVLEETPVAIPSEQREAASQLLFEQALKSWSTIFPSDDDKMLRSLVERCRWLKSVAPELDLPDLSQATMESVCRELCRQYQSLIELKKTPWIDWIMNSISREQMITLNREAPERITVPSGSSILIEYRQDQPPILAVRIQEIFSWKATPRLAMGRVPVLLHLLAPNMRPQQVTEDLASFWSSGYAIVKKELKRRYPKHAWPDDPTTATPTARTTRHS
ncbi:MAG: helicase-related protein [Planctomycetota bacterium]|nr:helicase-related protein [Planctomycetota bacterium]